MSTKEGWIPPFLFEGTNLENFAKTANDHKVKDSWHFYDQSFHKSSHQSQTYHNQMAFFHCIKKLCPFSRAVRFVCVVRPPYLDNLWKLQCVPKTFSSLDDGVPSLHGIVVEHRRDLKDEAKWAIHLIALSQTNKHRESVDCQCHILEQVQSENWFLLLMEHCIKKEPFPKRELKLDLSLRQPITRTLESWVFQV